MTGASVGSTAPPPTRWSGVRWSSWIGWALSVLPAMFLLLGGVMNVLQPPMVLEGSAQIGFAQQVLAPLGVVTIVSVALYLAPPTCVIGCILLTGFLGGAVATHVRMGDPLFPQTLMPVLFAAALWLGLVLRYPLLRTAVFRPAARRDTVEGPG